MIFLALLAGCLPHGALGAGKVEGAVGYLLESEGRSYPLTQQWARAFSDGSNGWLVCLEAEETHCVELRAFPSGEVLVLRGVESWPEPLRVLTTGMWPMLSARVQLSDGLVSSWPIGGSGRGQSRLVATGPWTREGRAFRWSPTLGVASPDGWTGSGTLDGSVVLKRAEVVEARWVLDVSVCRPGGACETWATRAALRRSEVSSPVRSAVPCPQRGESESRAPLCLADGTVLDGVGGARGTP